MKGSVYKKPTNNKYYPYIYDKETKRKKWGHGHNKKSDAEKELRQLLSDYDCGSVVFEKSSTFEAVFEQWLEIVAPELYTSKCSLSTNKGYINNHVIKVLGKIRIDRIDTRDIQRLFFELKPLAARERKELSPATKRKIMGILNSVFSCAKEWGLVGENPCAGIKLKSAPKKEMNIWNTSQLNYFLKLMSDSCYYLPLLILATTGMRRGEVCALQWRDFDGESLTLSRAMDISGNITDMKTSSSHRKVNIMSILATELEKQKEKQIKIAKLIGDKSPIGTILKPWDFICTREDNEKIKPGNITTSFGRAIAKNNQENAYQLPKIRLHDLRHGFATLALSNGENVKVVSEILGHAKTSTTQNIYQHATETMQRASISRIEDSMFNFSTEISTENTKKGAL